MVWEHAELYNENGKDGDNWKNYVKESCGGNWNCQVAGNRLTYYMNYVARVFQPISHFLT